jgi:aminoglycoside 6'-N-acetyltransferase
VSGWTFRALTRADFPLLSAWLEQPHVARWWADDPSPEALEADYGGCIDGTEPGQVFITCSEGRPSGLAQRYRLDDYPEYRQQLQPLLQVPPACGSIDYLVDADALGQGAPMLRAFVAMLWQQRTDLSCLLVPVHQENRASCIALEKCGFHQAAAGELEPDNPADSRQHLLYRLDRP